MRVRYFSVMIVFLLFASSLVHGQYDYNSDSALYRNNKVKSVKTYTYSYKNGKIKGDGKLIYDNSYNRDGLLTESFCYVIEDPIHRQYKYNEQGDIIEEIGYVMNHPISTTCSYRYDSLGRMIEQEKSRFDGLWQYTYDNFGNQTQIKWYLYGSSQPDSYFLDVFEYNDRNRITKNIRYNADNSIYFYFINDYDAKGNLTKQMRFENGDTTDIWINQYDTLGRCIESQVIDKLKKSIIVWQKSNYNANGLIIDMIGKLYSNTEQYCEKYIYEYYD